MNWLDSPIINAFRFTATVAFLLFIVSTALAHHGGGTFDNTKTIELKGRLTRLELINPHSWIYFEAEGPDGKVRAYRCEMRSATVLNSEKLHVVERFSLDTAKMELTRSYTAEDPVYFKGQYTGSDVIQVADLPYKPDACKEQAFIDYSKAAQNQK